MNITLPSPLVMKLTEIAEVWGVVAHTPEESIVETIQLLADNELSDEPKDEQLAADIHATVASIMEFNAGGSVQLTDIPDDGPTIGANFTFSDLQVCAVDDPLVIKALELDSEAQEALADLYTNIPTDLWGTEQAATMWERQRYFRASRGG